MDNSVIGGKDEAQRASVAVMTEFGMHSLRSRKTQYATPGGDAPERRG